MGFDASVDTVLAEVGLGIGWAQQGDRTGARLLFAQLWGQVGPQGDALHRCAIAHSMADVQDDPRDELQWDLLAFDAARDLDDRRLGEAGMAATVGNLFPSLHLNLGDVYRRLGDRQHAFLHLSAGRQALQRLPDDGYRSMISDGLDRLERRLREPAADANGSPDHDPAATVRRPPT